MPPHSCDLHALLAPFRPSDRSLLQWLAPQVDDALAHALGITVDGGDALTRTEALTQSLTATHLAGLDDLLGNMLPAPALPAEPSASCLRRAHVRRVLCWTLLLHATAAPHSVGFWTNTWGDQCEALIHFIESLMALGPAAMEHGCALLCWRVLTLTVEDAARPFFALGILLLAVATSRDGADGMVVRQVCTWVRAEEAWALAHVQERAPEPMVALVDALNLLDLALDDRYDAAWKQMVTRVLLAPPVPHPAAAADVLQELALRLTPANG